MPRPWLTAVAVLVMLGCATKQDPNRNDPGPITEPEPIATPVDSSEMELAAGWEEVLIEGAFGGSYTKTNLDLTGHFKTARNACGVEEVGAIPLAAWNATAKALNTAMTGTPLAEEKCFEGPSDRLTFISNVEVKIKENKRILLTAKGWDICTTIPDQAAAKALLNAVATVNDTAVTEGCPQTR